jgi:hypothetical protein
MAKFQHVTILVTSRPAVMIMAYRLRNRRAKGGPIERPPEAANSSRVSS